MSADAMDWPPSSTELLSLLDVSALARQQIGVASVDVLLAEPRFHDRLLQLLAGNAVPLDPVLDAGDRHLLRASASQWSELSRACGAVCHAQTFACAIQAAQVQTLTERFGRPLYELALRHRALAWLPAVSDDPAGLEATVCATGEACMAAWYVQLSLSSRDWMRLRGFDEGAPVGDEHDARRLEIVRAVAVDYFAEAADKP
ncbi:hypothetical protein [Pseudomonas sp. YJ42]